MIKSDVIIIGGGPAGSACAWRLRRAGVETRILDKATFPRTKLCAGWITPKVLADLSLHPDDYPGSITEYRRIIFHIKGVPLPIPVRQYAIRRVEFDQFLLGRADVPVHRHTVSVIRREQKGEYKIDNKFRCRYLVGAGGTHCPVYRTFFRQVTPRRAVGRIDTAEIEFAASCRDNECRLWFFDSGLPGYAWYVPKGNGVLNIGIGGKTESLQKKKTTIRWHWDRFTEKLMKKQLISEIPEPKGYVYYQRNAVHQVQTGRAYLTGDAAGLATLDMGEGIGPAVRSGLAAAESIISGRSFHLGHLGHISRFSLPGILRSRFSMMSLRDEKVESSGSRRRKS